MATLKFYLKPENKKNLCPVIMCYQDKGKKFRFFTKVFAEKNKWLNDRLKAISLGDYENNEKLDACENVIKQIQKESLENKIYYSVKLVEQKFRECIFKTECYTSIKNEIQTNEKEQQSEFFNYYDLFVEQNDSIKAKKTQYHYHTFKKILLDFEKYFGIELSYSVINTGLYNKFLNYLINEKGYLNNTVGCKVKFLKTFLNYSMRNEFTDLKLHLQDFKVFKEDIDIISLNEEELFKIYNCKNLNHFQKIAKDYLCFECFTGLRFSDISKLKSENIKGDFIEIRTTKTKDLLFVPLSVFAKEILYKYRNMAKDLNLLPALSNAEANEYIKEVAEKAGIKDIVMIEKFSGSKRIVITKPKYMFISTHTGRRTFITLSHEKGMQIEMIMKITGIKKWETLRKYLKVSEKSKLIKMNEFWNRDCMKAATN